MDNATTNTPKRSVSLGLRFHIITGRELERIFTLPRALIFILISTLVPFLVADASEISSYPVETQTLLLRDILFFITYFWIAGILLVFFASWIVTDFIAGEDNRGTLLSLITKPIHRWEVVLGKFLAYIIFIVIMEAIAISIAIFVLVTVSGSHLSVIGELVQYLPILVIYSLFVALVFGSIPLAFSTISKSRVLIMIFMSIFIILMYFGFFIIRMGFTDYYVDYQLYHFDIGYHMGNVFILFIEATDVQLTPTFQAQMGLFAGTHDLTAPLTEPDQNFSLPSIPLTNYYTKTQSILFWTLIPIGLVFLALFQLNRKEIS